jgi:poly(A) polymerase/tRNA nucleotidyltransferase (CCA-adding enzyme)
VFKLYQKIEKNQILGYDKHIFMIIPKEVKSVVNELKKKGYEAYIVGGCVRDVLRGAEPEDWDVATNAKPREIQKIFPKSFYKNRFLTVTIRTDSKNPKLKEIEVTTYRSEAKYTDKRHPDEVRFAKTLKEDMARRDFTVNAIALSIKAKMRNSKSKILNSEFVLIDPFSGQEDLKNKIIRTVGDAQKRFSEDALRMFRAVRFSITLGEDWQIETKTSKAIKKNSPWLQAISKERVRDELMKVIMSEQASKGIELLRELELLQYIIPELVEGYGVSQNKHHIYDCYEHSLKSLDYGAKRNFNKYVRLAALLHDVAKPRAKRGQGPDSTFYGHEMKGAKMVAQILNRLKFSKKDIEKIVKLVRYHLFYYNVGEVTASSVRRLVRQVGLENMEELLQVRMCDRIGSGVPKAEPYKLRHLKYLIEKVSRDPLSVKMLKVTGNDVISQLGISPGPKVGYILDILLRYVLDDPKKNVTKWLSQKMSQLAECNIVTLEKMSQSARKEREDLEMKKDKMTKKKYWVT